jgi:hypothetical protein
MKYIIYNTYISNHIFCITYTNFIYITCIKYNNFKNNIYTACIIYNGLF